MTEKMQEYGVMIEATVRYMVKVKAQNSKEASEIAITEYLTCESVEKYFADKKDPWVSEIHLPEWEE